MSDSGSSEHPSRPAPQHECPPDCPMMNFVIQWSRKLFEEDDMDVSLEDMARGFAHCFEDFKKKFDDGDLDPNFFLHVLLLIQKYDGFGHPDDYEQELPELNEPTVIGGAPLQNNHIRKILVKIGFPEAECSSESLTNNEAGSMLLENMDRIYILAQEGELDRSELRRIRCFATQNGEQLTAQKKKRKSNKKKAK